MKTNSLFLMKCLVVSIAFLYSQSVYGQNGNGQGSPWKTLGNNINDTVHFLGTVNNAGIVFKTNDTEKVRISPDGHMGIGTATPFARLSVVGSGNDATTSSLDVVNGIGNPMMRILDNGNVGIGSVSPTARVMILTGGNSAATSALAILNNSGSPLFYVKDNGFTGVGTATPTTTLDVHGNMSFDNSIGDKISLYDDRIGQTDMYGFGMEASAIYYKSNGDHKWYVQTNPGAGSPVMTANNIGLGIGTTNPTSAVDVHGELTFDNTLGDKISLYDDRIGQTDMYGLGVTDGAMYYKSNGTHKWFTQTNAGAGAPHMTLTNGGFLGIGTENPSVNLTVEGANARMVLRDNAGNNSENAARIELLEYSGGLYNGGAFMWWNGLDNKFLIGTKNGGVNENVLVINRSGLNVGIGTSTPDNNFRLAVNGRIRAKEIVVESGWSDFVFEEDYHLRDLEEVEKFIKANKHLPEIPSAKEIEENGVSLGEINSKLLMKIEELTLYLIELKKDNDLLHEAIQELKSK